jgi:hypothetical protein
VARARSLATVTTHHSSLLTVECRPRTPARGFLCSANPVSEDIRGQTLKVIPPTPPGLRIAPTRGQLRPLAPCLQTSNAAQRNNAGHQYLARVHSKRPSNCVAQHRYAGRRPPMPQRLPAELSRRRGSGTETPEAKVSSVFRRRCSPRSCHRPAAMSLPAQWCRQCNCSRSSARRLAALQARGHTVFPHRHRRGVDRRGQAIHVRGHRPGQQICHSAVWPAPRSDARH